MKKILPMADPEIRCYANYAHIFSILGAGAKNYYPWLYNYYMQLCAPNDYTVFPVDYMVEGMYTNTPNLFSSRIKRDVAVSIRNGIINFIRFVIDCGYYIYLELEIDKIAAYKDMYTKFHDPLLYGYDDEKEEIYFADTYINGRYSKGVATYSEIINATGNELSWRARRETNLGLDVLCMKCSEENEPFLFNVKTFQLLLKHYLNEVDSIKAFWEIPGVTKEEQWICGIGIYTIMKRHLQFVRESNGIIDQRGFYVILEHKILLKKALNYLMGEQWGWQYPLEAQLMELEIEKATLCMHLCLKYNITKDKKQLNKISECATNLEKNEKELFPRLINILDNV